MCVEYMRAARGHLHTGRTDDAHLQTPDELEVSVLGAAEGGPRVHT